MRALTALSVAALSAPAMGQEGALWAQLGRFHAFSAGAWREVHALSNTVQYSIAVDHATRDIYYMTANPTALHRTRQGAGSELVGVLATGYGEITFAPCTGMLYGLVTVGQTFEIHEIDPGTGAARTIASGPLPSFTIMAGLSFNPADAQFYFIFSGLFPGVGTTGVYRIDALNGGAAVRVIPTLPNLSRSIAAWGDKVFIVCTTPQFPTSFVATISNPGAGWSPWPAVAGTTGVASGVDVAGWLAPPITPAPCGTPCYPDCDPGTGQGVLDIFDFLCFQNRFAANDPYACDCDTSSGPGVCDIFDFLCFQNAFDAGCP